MMSSAAWDGQDQHMSTGPDDEFNQFLDMTGIGTIPDATAMQFDFHTFNDASSSAPQPMMPGAAHQHQHQHAQHQHQHQHQQQRQQPPPTAADALMTDPDPSAMIPRSDGLLQNHTPAMSAVSHPSIPAHMLATSAPDSISNIDAQIHYLQQQKFQQQQRQLQDQHATFYGPHGHHSVPPTPQSLEMPPGSGQFYSQAEQLPQRTAYDRGYHQRVAEQDMAFTPLVSPAVTPLDPHFNMDSTFAVPGSYFSPLTSPALHAQPDASVYDHSTNSNNSPIDMDLETPPATQTVPPSQDLAKKARRNNAAKARSKSGVKNSPIAKPQRRKVGPSPAIVSQVLSEVDERRLQSGGETGLLPLPATSTEGSDENASVSPENLTDMPPPPVPARRSNSKSPYIQAQNGNPSQALPLSINEERQQPHPATPASLMKLPSSKGKKPQSTQQGDTATEHIESLELPESVSNRPLAPINTQISSQFPGNDQPVSARSTGFHPSPSPNLRPVGGTLSASASPSLGPRSAGPSARKTPQLLSRNSRKRSTGSVHVSPALLPRISPNIKPLIPGTPGMSAEDTSRLLMSKSNYQNILEGNTVPGVSYPTELSTNLTSKRTSHKIAEQGRRNRINSALQVMASLLPDQGNPTSEDGEEKKDGKPGGSSNSNNTPSSKASVVENAIVHMKNLQKENGDLKKELEELRNKLEAMQKS
ncbi:phosphorus acquisition-controlling protein [Cordyceps fumosorosea ARSEF 2679]|uniref:Phosphorus acquisition-controlling protein n=1 Tax=Cordyceps fumosorosea (strain ARSEF 2679) TaxID=1081104 RepID=A0A168E129_CORFA|nr:phosphorus acquisition-controlling protein [Cordyceps fumosorosea ARSEF 2679]OAA73253.1 phosphorus acquisition-controlling protein [Cordyceps fumosorosea ARSEF 2679]